MSVEEVPKEEEKAVVGRCTTVKDVPPGLFVKALAAHWKKSGKFELPEWHDLIKTAPYKEMCPIDPDWYYTRCASVARRVYLKGGIGVGCFRRIYGGHNRRGVRKPHFALSAGGLVRHILQELGEQDIVAKRKNKNGRWITQNGQRELDIIAGQVYENTPGIGFFEQLIASEQQQQIEREQLETQMNEPLDEHLDEHDEEHTDITGGPIDEVDEE